MSINNTKILDLLQVVKKEQKHFNNIETYKKCFGCMDYTSLNATDTLHSGRLLADRVNNFSEHYDSIPNAAAVCVYPVLVQEIRKKLTAPDVKIASVGAGFPSSQTYIDVKIRECVEAVANGADEIDIVISLHHFLGGNQNAAFDEVAQIKRALGNVCLKVILETGALMPTQIYEASMGCMEAGADFIKTSTGKISPAATPEAAAVMCMAIREHYRITGKKTGFKSAGGIAEAEDAALYYSIVQHILGTEWLTPKLFRIGASRLANRLLSKITEKDEKYF